MHLSVHRTTVYNSQGVEATSCPSAEEWINVCVRGVCVFIYVHIVEYYSAVRWNKTVTVAETWMDLEALIQSEVNQKEKNKYCVLMHI